MKFTKVELKNLKRLVDSVKAKDVSWDKIPRGSGIIAFSGERLTLQEAKEEYDADKAAIYQMSNRSKPIILLYEDKATTKDLYCDYNANYKYFGYGRKLLEDNKKYEVYAYD